MASKKSTVSLSIDSEVLAKVRMEATAGNTSLNSSVNAILKKHVEFYQPSLRIGSVISPAIIWQEIINKLDEKDLEEVMVDKSSTAMKTLLKHRASAPGMNDAIKYVFQEVALWCGICSYFNYSVNEDGQMTLIFTHLFGPKWSRILGTLFSRFIEEALDHSAALSLTENTVVIRVKKK